MKNLIPHFIQEKFLADTSQGSMDAYTMFIDLSGFTPLTESLMHMGTQGAEQLSVLLNEIFEPLVGLVYAWGGFIPYFAGDAFTAIFPVADSRLTAREIIQAAFQARNLFSQRESKFGEFTIGIKIGLSFGEVEWGIVGNKGQKAFYFRGKPIDSCSECQLKAKDQDIVIDRILREQFAGKALALEEIDPHFYRITGGAFVEKMPESGRDLPEIKKKVAGQFLPASVVKYNHEGEFRNVISVFLSFDGVSSHQALDEFVNMVLLNVRNCSGYFKEIDFGDKGGVLVCLFGAPVSFENNVERALEFILSVREEVRTLEKAPLLKFRAGITFGTAYTGIIGGKERCQYAAVGNYVNLAARLMTYADWGEILVDEEIQKNRHFKFLHKGDIKYKGIKSNIPTFKLSGRNFESRTVYTGKMVEREQELRQLVEFFEEMMEGNPAGLALIYGEAGIGKSRLTYELKNILKDNHTLEWFTCLTDQILKKPFNPFLYFLKDYFDQSQDKATFLNISNFESRFRLLEKALTDLEQAEAQIVLNELQRTRTVLAALLGINYKDSLWEQLDAKGRYLNTISAIITLIIAESLRQPVVLELEDSHWIDDNSAELLQELVRRMGHHPIFLLITSRYHDDGSKPVLVDHETIRQLGLPYLEINLDMLPNEAVRSFAELVLGGEITDDFYELLLRTTNSNPFYLEQMLEYFSESDLLSREDHKWTIKDKNIKLSNSINSILTARIDRLSTLVRETVKAAAVIGREFEITILSEVMKSQEEFSKYNESNTLALLKEQVKTAEQGQIWQAMNELRYIFKHSLLRETVYSMQLGARLQQLHRLIAQAIERLYGNNNIEERYVDLAFHYEQAGVFDKTCEYLRKAADHARRNYQNQIALEYYEQLLKKLGRQADTVDEVQTYLKKGRILELIGNWEECRRTYQKALELAKKLRDVLLLGQANNSLGRLLMLQGDYGKAMSYLQIAAGLFDSIEDKMGTAKVYGDLGNLYFRQGKYDEAKSYFEQSIKIGYAKTGSAGSAQIVANLGLTYMNQGDYDEGIRVQQHQLKVCERNNDKQGMATLYTNIGIVYFEKGDYDSALNSYRQGLALSEELGNKLLTSIAIGCIGSVYERQGNYDLAMEHFRRDLELCEELGDKQGTAIALGLIGELLSVTGNFHKAIEYLQKNLMLCEELGYQKGIAKAVNTLGDVFYYLGQYERSIHFYDRAIEIARKIENRLVLGFSLAEKGAVLLAMGEEEAMAAVSREASKVAAELGNPDLIFEASMLAARTRLAVQDERAAKAILLEQLTHSLDKEKKASVYFELSKIDPDNPEFREKALEYYQELFAATPKFIFKNKMEALTDSVS